MKDRAIPGLAPWIGGKRNLAGRLAARIDATPHHCYAEVFLGMGGVFFRRTSRPHVEVINDLNGEVVNLFRIVQRHPHALLDALRGELFSRAGLERAWRLDPAALTDIERAVRLLAIQRGGFSGRPTSRSFAVTPLTSKARAPGQRRAIFLRAWRRLAGVTIEQLPYAEMIRRYDRPGTLFYLDPPYWGLEDLYGRGMFERGDFERLAELLTALRGRFILSLNDVPEVRAMFGWARIEEEPVTYKARGTKRVVELVISSP